MSAYPNLIEIRTSDGRLNYEDARNIRSIKEREGGGALIHWQTPNLSAFESSDPPAEIYKRWVRAMKGHAAAENLEHKATKPEGKQPGQWWLCQVDLDPYALKALFLCHGHWYSRCNSSGTSGLDMYKVAVRKPIARLKLAPIDDNQENKTLCQED